MPRSTYRHRSGHPVGNRISSYLWVATCAGVAAAAALVLFLEASPYFLSGLSAEAKLEAIVHRGLEPGLSFESQEMVLDDCYSASLSLLARASPTPVRAKLIDRCQEIAGQITAATPSHGYAWFVAAALAAESGDGALLNSALLRSHRSSPNELWLAEARVTLGELHLASLGSEALAGHDRDVSSVVSSNRLSPEMAELYIGNEGFRGRVNELLAALPTNVQRRFISQVRSEMAGP